jgi:hypothetical protein
MYGASRVTARNTLAVLIHTHGSFMSCSIVFGGIELYSFSSISEVLIILLDLLLKNDID